MTSEFMFCCSVAVSAARPRHVCPLPSQMQLPWTCDLNLTVCREDEGTHEPPEAAEAAAAAALLAAAAAAAAAEVLPCVQSERFVLSNDQGQDVMRFATNHSEASLRHHFRVVSVLFFTHNHTERAKEMNKTRFNFSRSERGSKAPTLQRRRRQRHQHPRHLRLLQRQSFQRRLQRCTRVH